MLRTPDHHSAGRQPGIAPDGTITIADPAAPDQACGDRPDQAGYVEGSPVSKGLDGLFRVEGSILPGDEAATVKAARTVQCQNHRSPGRHDRCAAAVRQGQQAHFDRTRNRRKRRAVMRLGHQGKDNPPTSPRTPAPGSRPRMRGCASSPTTSPTSGPPASSAIAPISPRHHRTRAPPGSVRRAKPPGHRAQSRHRRCGPVDQPDHDAGALNTTGCLRPRPGRRWLFRSRAAGRPCRLYPCGQFHHLGRGPADPSRAMPCSRLSPCPKARPQSRYRPTAPCRQPCRAVNRPNSARSRSRVSPIRQACRRSATTSSKRPPAVPPSWRCRRTVAAMARQGMLEASNVNIVEELVEMIEAQRAYEISSPMVSAVDEMLRNANQTL